ncbi:MAG TPA: thiamine phosphate synthase [Thermodesulfobacteriota bacterium]|nr:thiamine phosphate synthase [Thermodesulfobacteriota bacterium]
MIDFNLYLITDRHQTNGRPLVAVVKEALQAGIKAIQLREKDLSAKELFELAQNVRRLTRQYRARFFINDRVDIAMAVEADGVHLGQKSFSAKDVKRIFPKAIIGVSTHSLDEAKKAEADEADFITIGPIFYTPSKAGYGEPLGVEVIKQVRKEIRIPVFAVGGIKEDNARDVIDAGADGIAVISAVMRAEDVEEAVREMYAAISQK